MINKTKHAVRYVTATWAYNHKHLIITLSLATALVWQAGILQPHLPTVAAETVVVYQREETPVAKQLEERALEIAEERRDMDLEKYRQEAIQELNRELLHLTEDSPFVDYEALAEKYGY